MNSEALKSYSYEQANLINGFRILFTKMTYLIRFYIVESITGLGNPEATYNEILNLPFLESQPVENIPGHSEEIPRAALAYLMELKTLIDGIIQGDQAKADKSIQRLYEISGEYAKTLAIRSPY